MADTSWTHTLTEPVEEGADVTFPATGASSADLDFAQAEVAVGNDVIELDTIAITPTAGVDGATDTLTITNNSGFTWPPGDSVYVVIHGKTLLDVTEEVQAAFDALDARIAALEASVSALDARVVALESAAP